MLPIVPMLEKNRGNRENMFGWLKQLFASRPAPSAGSKAAGSLEEMEQAEPARFDLSTLAEFDADLRTEPTASERQQVQRITSVVTDQYDTATESLPAFPAMLTEVIGLLNDNDVPLSKIVAVISRDPPVATQVIKLANSSLYRGARSCDSIRDAVVRVGAAEIAVVAASQASQKMLGFRRQNPRVDMYLRRHWQRCLTAALYSIPIS